MNDQLSFRTQGQVPHATPRARHSSRPERAGIYSSGEAIAVAKIGILIIENDEANQSALRQLLDSEGWHVRVVPMAAQALAELSSGEWSLVIANIQMLGLTSPVCLTL